MTTDCPFTMEDIRKRCASCEEGECWEWRGTYLHDGRRPVIAKRMDTPKGRTNKQFYARHIVVWLVRGAKPQLGLYRAIVTTCENECCVNPAHLKVVSRKTVVQKVAAAGTFSTTAHRMKVAQGARRHAKLSEEGVHDIRTSSDSAKVAAEKHGVTAAYVYMLRRGEFRQDYANPFAALQMIGPRGGA